MTTATKETMGFQTEVRQLLDLMIHSLYSNKEIFLRELVSNASDACDKLRFEALTDKDLFEQDADLKIRVSFDKAARTITVADNGIGMSREEVIANIGTIAKSGTHEFFKAMTGEQAKDANLIGQFGVGFYSSFIVADRVTLTTRRAGAPASAGVRWESDGAGEFTIEPVEQAARGTEVTLHLREGEDEILSGSRLRTIIHKYSDHIVLPVVMKKEEWDKDKSEYVIKDEDETVNQASALWTRPKKDITAEQYQEFYKQVSHDHEPPLAWAHNRVEGSTEYVQLLFIPSHAPFDLWNREKAAGVKLYVKRVFIMDDAQALMPAYLRFVRGVIDSSDLPLNVSRELLQESRDVRAIREGSTKRVLSMLEDLAKQERDEAASAEDKGKYAKFWSEFGAVLKEGLGEDMGNSERIAKLARYASTSSDAATVSLADYKARMKEGQEAIYFITADTLAAAKNSPQLEVFRKKGIEVLLMTDRVDEWALNYLQAFDGTPLQSVAKGQVDLGKLQDEAEKKAAEEAAETFKPVLEKLKEALKDQVQDVRVTTRLVDSPACLVVTDQGMSMQLARMLKQAGQKLPEAKPVLEVNADHALVKKLESSDRFDDLAHILFDQAVLAEGGLPDDPAAYVKRVNALLA